MREQSDKINKFCDANYINRYEAEYLSFKLTLK